tara:strand:- start:15592 stop:18105 length:2514 start_codon:yes stop_codon:yes gene_type:complete
MDGKQFLTSPKSVLRTGVMTVLVSCTNHAAFAADADPSQPDWSNHQPEPLLVDETLSSPIEDSLMDVSAALVRPRGRVLQAERKDRTATLVLATTETAPSQRHADVDTDISVSRPAAAESTWLRMQAEQHKSEPETTQPQVEVADRPTSIDEALLRRGSISFRKTPISEVVFLLSDLWKINIVAGENVTGDVSGTFHEAPLREVLGAVLTASGYSYQRNGRSLVVLPIDEVGSDDPNFVTETLQLPSGSIDESETIEATQLLLSERGELRKLGNNMVLIVDSEDRIERVRALYRQLSPSSGRTGAGNPANHQTAPGATQLTGQASSTPAHVASGIAYFSPQYTEASEMAESLSTALGDDAIIAVYAEENRIMVKGNPDVLRLATEAIGQLDVPRAQVRITAMIYDVGLTELERLGVDWSQRPHSSTIQAFSPSDDTSVFRNEVTASTGLISDPTAAGAANLAIRTLNNSFDAGMLLQALNSISESKLLADPSITVGDRREASIKIVQRIPILAADPVENSGVVFSQVQFEDAGVILNVTPRISRDGTIEMQVQPEYSVVVDFIDNNPVIDSRTAQTTLRVQDGHMFVLGGLRQKTITETVRGVPFLKDMKHFGKLFRAHETQVRDSELIVFIKPEIVVPCSLGAPREERAKCISNCQLDQIAHATHTPQTPYCGNINCPNHAPRPRVNGGSFDLQFTAGADPHHATATIDGMPSQSEVISVIQDDAGTIHHVDSAIDEDVYLRLHRDLRSMESPATNSKVPTATMRDTVVPESQLPLSQAATPDGNMIEAKLPTSPSASPHRWPAPTTEKSTMQGLEDVVIQNIEPPLFIRRVPMSP